MMQTFLMRCLIFLFLLPLMQIGKGQVTTYFVPPVLTDPGYVTMQDSHGVKLDLTVQINKLLLFIGGTNSTTAQYVGLRNHAVSLGFHVINLSYPNTVAAASLSGSTDSLVYNKFREEICFGTPLSMQVSVDSLNSLHTRTVKLLLYLHATYPSQNWAQFMTLTGEPNWSKIVLAGHSQGSGHAAYLGKKVLADRVLMFSGPNEVSDVYLRPGNWVRQPGMTPVSQHYAYHSLADEVIPNAYAKQFSVIEDLGMLVNDDTTLVDALTPPFADSHCLYTRQAPGLVILNHNVPVKNTALNRDVWEYMLLSTPPVRIEVPAQAEIVPFPNPVGKVMRLQGLDPTAGQDYRLLDLTGQERARGRLQGAKMQEISLPELAPGIYFMQIGTQMVRFVKQ